MFQDMEERTKVMKDVYRYLLPKILEDKRKLEDELKYIEYSLDTQVGIFLHRHKGLDDNPDVQYRLDEYMQNIHGYVDRRVVLRAELRIVRGAEKDINSAIGKQQ